MKFGGLLGMPAMENREQAFKRRNIAGNFQRDGALEAVAIPSYATDGWWKPKAHDRFEAQVLVMLGAPIGSEREAADCPIGATFSGAVLSEVDRQDVGEVRVVMKERTSPSPFKPRHGTPKSVDPRSSQNRPSQSKAYILA